MRFFFISIIATRCLTHLTFFLLLYIIPTDTFIQPLRCCTHRCAFLDRISTKLYSFQAAPSTTSPSLSFDHVTRKRPTHGRTVLPVKDSEAISQIKTLAASQRQSSGAGKRSGQLYDIIWRCKTLDISSLNQEEISDLIWSLGTLGLTRELDPEVNKVIESTFARYEMLVMNSKKSLSARSIAKWLVGLARMDTSSQHLLVHLPLLESIIQTTFQMLNAQGLANVVHSFGKIGLPCYSLSGASRRLILQQVCENSHQLTDQGISSILWGLHRMQFSLTE